MNKKILLYDIYSILMQEDNKNITIDEICKQIKCSKKSIYKHFDSKNNMLLEIFELYTHNFKGLLSDISKFSCSPAQKLIFQIKIIDQSARLFFKSSLFKKLKPLKEFETLIVNIEKDILAVGFTKVIQELKVKPSHSEAFQNIVVFIVVSIKQYYTIGLPQKEINHKDFLQMLLTLLLSYISKEQIIEQIPVKAVYSENRTI